MRKQFESWPKRSLKIDVFNHVNYSVGWSLFFKLLENGAHPNT